MKTAGNLQVTTPSDRELVVARVFDAPRSQVFHAWTRPALLQQWLLGPPGWTMPVCEVDLQVGGKYRFEWRNHEGTEMGMGGFYREITAPERLVITELFDEDWTGGETLCSLVLTEDNCKTTMTQTVRYSSREARDSAMGTGMIEGMAMGYDRLAELLKTRLREPGEFCWINMLTPQPDQAREFFGKLLGWSYFEMPGMEHGIQVGGRNVGGLFDLNGPNTPPGLRPTIGVMVRVENADAIGERAVAIGGQAKPAFDVGDQGRMACCTDPNGAEFDVWQPKQGSGTDVDPSLPGAPCWFESLTSDAPRAAKFYSELFGWKADVMQMPGWTYTTFKFGEMYTGGMMQFTPEMIAAGMRPHWGVYFTVNDTDATARKAVELGASLCVPPRDIPGIGRFCGIVSPQGVMFYVVKHVDRAK